jgi:DNA-binding IclR family transcriptional regulator
MADDTRSKEDSGNRRSRGLDRAFELLDFLRLKREPLRPNEIAAELGAPRSSVYELVNLLLGHGILEYSGGDGRVFLGRRLYFLGTAYAEQFDLMHEADALLLHLAEETRETAQLCMLEGNKYTVTLMKEGIRPFRISSNVGEPVPLPWTASGRLLLSHLMDEEILGFIPAEDFTLPDGKKLDPAHFLEQVHEAAEAGYFTFNSTVDTFTHCFAVPVYRTGKECVATLCLVTPKEDGLKNHAHYLTSLQRVAQDLSARLGHTAEHDPADLRRRRA